jgi:prevent-host-death family protein
VGVRELRQNLSVHLDRVKRGQSLLVTERGRVVAVLMPSTHELSPLERLIAEGRATPASRSLRDLPRPRRTRALAGASEDVISDLRGERLP